MRTMPIVIIALLIMITGCSTAPPPRTPGMESVGLDLTTLELRRRVYQYESNFASAVHQAADEIFASNDNRDVREMTIRWKINSVPQMQAAVFQADPLAALADAWGLTAQMDNFFTTGNGKELFGDSQSIAVDTSQELRAEIRTLARHVVGPERISEVEPELREWLADNPIIDISLARRSTDIDAASITAAAWGGGGALQSVGQLEDLVRDLSDRMTIYATQLPELSRSQAELLTLKADRYMLDPVWKNVDGIEGSAQSLDAEVRKVREFLDATPNLIASERDAIVAAFTRELEAALLDVDRQRVATLDAISGEREAVFDDVNSLHAAVVSDFDQARATVTTDVEVIVERQAQAFVVEAEGLIDLVFWRILILLAIGLVGLALVLRWARPRATA